MRGGKREGSGRKSEGRIHVSYRLKPEVIQVIKDKAQELGVHQNEAIEYMVEREA